MERSITEVARLTGVTSRALRHYDRIGLLEPSRVAPNGYRYYDEAALVRLQRVLLLRELGVGLAAMVTMLDSEPDAVAALRDHLGRLEAERVRLARRITSVRTTVETLEKKGRLMAETMFDGFDHRQYEAEVEERWGPEAAARGNAWWTSMTSAERTAWTEQLGELNAAWADAAARGVDPAGPEGQELAGRHTEWLTGIPGTPGAGTRPDPAYLTELGELYVDDERFAANYDGWRGAEFVRDALAAYAAALPA
jgi:DNA-binding transcriptional MerR regulator